MAFSKVGALWLSEKNGKKYMSGSVQEEIPAGSKVFVFKNTFKKDDRHPDYTINIAADDPPPTYSQAPPSEEDIPF